MPAVDGIPDSLRPLSEEGSAQADALEWRLAEEGAEFAIAFHSYAARAEMTCRIATTHRPVDMVSLDCLFTGNLEDPVHVTIDDAFAEYGYSLAPYFTNRSVALALAAFAVKAKEQILAVLKERGIEEGDVLVVCHAVIANALALALTGFDTPQERELSAEWELGEAECLMVDGKSVRIIPAM